MNFSPSQLAALVNDVGEARVTRNEPLKNHTYMKVGGPADVFFIARSEEDLKTAVRAAIKHHLPYHVLGGGSNVVIRDGGLRGLVVKNRADKISLAGFKGTVTASRAGVNSALVKAESGVIVNYLVRFTLEESLGGLEEFLGIPGTVGGAIINNSHHLGHLIGNYIQNVTVLDRHGKEKVYSQKELQFAYDYSILQRTHEVVLSAIFSLKSADKNVLWQKAEAALRRRRDTQPLEFPSSGCMFKNIGQAAALTYNTPNHATSAGFLIEAAGLKGERVGGAKVSEKHANFIVNTGTATAKDILTLAQKIRTTIKAKYGVTLESEVFVLGDEE